MIHSQQNTIQSIGKAPETGLERQSGESAMWFNRYCLYRNLGAKRTLKAALLTERAQMSLVQTDENAPASTEIKKSGETDISALLKNNKGVNVPGSWKAASSHFFWVERAKAFDAFIIAETTKEQLSRLMMSFASKYKRIQLLDEMLTSVKRQMDDEFKHRRLTHPDYQVYLKVLQGLLKEMRRETHGLDDAKLQAALQSHLTAQYEQGIEAKNLQAFAMIVEAKKAEFEL